MLLKKGHAAFFSSARANAYGLKKETFINGFSQKVSQGLLSHMIIKIITFKVQMLQG